MNKNPSPYKNKKYQVGEVYVGIKSPKWDGKWIKLDGSSVNYPIPPHLRNFLKINLSPDISTITKTGTTTNGMDIAYDGSSVYMTGMATVLLSSTDGIAWTTQTTFTTAVHGIAYGNGIWLAVDKGGKMKTSTDSVTWVTGSATFGLSSSDRRSIAYGLIGGQPMWVIPSGPEVSGNTYVRTSTDTITWNSVSANQTTGSLNVVAYNGGNSTFVAAGTGSGGFRASTDAVTWNTGSPAFYQAVTSITSNNIIFVAGSSGTNYATWSTDGISWSSTPNAFTTSCRSLSYMNGLFLQAGNSGSYATSTLGYSGYTKKNTGLTAASATGIAYTPINNAIITNSSLGLSNGPEIKYKLPTLSYGNNVFGWLNI